MRHDVGVLVTMLLAAHAATAQFGQQGGKLVGSGAVGRAEQGWSVAISEDGNTAIVGGPFDNSSGGAADGAAWVFMRSMGTWSQQGSKLVGSGAVGAANQGWSVAISAEGSSAIIGGSHDNSGVGASWVFTRNGSVWSQQGPKLVGAGAIGGPQGLVYQGTSVAISADGNTAIVGGNQDNSGAGAAWVFTRSAGVWSQQGTKLVGSDAVGAAQQGQSVAISADGNTIVVGGPGDNSGVGAAWVFTRNAGMWLQQGSKLVGTGAVFPANQGFSVAISEDGTTAIIGGPIDNSIGAAWVFTRDGGVWSQQGGKLVGTGAVFMYAEQGTSVAISANGDTAIIGAPRDNPSHGAADGASWVFARSGGVWSQQGGKLVGTGAEQALQGHSVAISADGTTAIVGGPEDHDLVGAAWVFSLPTFAAWVPVAAHNPGLNRSQWRSDLGLLNPHNVAANVRIDFFGSSGIVSNTAYVPPGAQSVLTDVVGQLGTSGQGALEVLSDLPLKITSRTYNQVSEGAACYPNGTQGQNYPTVTAGGGLVEGQSAYLAGLAENARYRSNIGLVNVGSGPASVLVELFDGAGTKLTEYTVGLAVGQWAQEVQPFRNQAGETSLDRGYAKVTVQSGGGVFAFASLVDNITNDPTTVVMQR